MRYNPEGVRLTHLPTGVQARSQDCAPRGNKWGFYRTKALAMLKAKLAHTPEPARPVRTYDLCPPFGIAPNVREGGRVLAAGREAVDGLWEGRMPWLTSMDR